MQTQTNWSESECIKQFSDKLCEFNHKTQAIFFMNAFWGDFFGDEVDGMSSQERMKICFGTEKLLRKNRLEKKDLEPLPKAERVWIAYKYFVQLEKKNAKGQDSSLDESPGSHRLLELMGQALSVIQFRKVFKTIDQNFDKKMSMVEYLVYIYNTKQQPKKFICEMMRRPQGSNPVLDAANKALEAVRAQIKKIEDKKHEWEGRIERGGNEGRKAQRFLDDLLKQQKDIAEIDEKEEKFLKQKELGGVKAIRAKQELAQLEVRANQVGLLYAFRPILKAAIKAVEEAREKHGGGGDCEGQQWWLERELDEAKAYKPAGDINRSYHKKKKDFQY